MAGGVETRFIASPGTGIMQPIVETQNFECTEKVPALSIGILC